MHMKAIRQIFLTATALFFMSTALIAQPPPPGDHGQDENQPAPIGSGLVILLGLGAAYGGKKVYDARKKMQD